MDTSKPRKRELFSSDHNKKGGVDVGGQTNISFFKSLQGQMLLLFGFVGIIAIVLIVGITTGVFAH